MISASIQQLVNRYDNQPALAKVIEAEWGFDKYADHDDLPWNAVTDEQRVSNLIRIYWKYKSIRQISLRTGYSVQRLGTLAFKLRLPRKPYAKERTYTDNNRQSTNAPKVQIFDTSTGITYIGLEAAAKAHHINSISLSRYLNGKRKNITSLIKIPTSIAKTNE